MMIERPSPPQLVVRVGVTGHRERPSLSSPALLAKVQTTLQQIRRIAQEAFEENRPLFDSTQREPTLRLVSSLAQGADQLVAQEALRQGYKLHAPLPFLREIYAQDPDLGSVDEFECLLADTNTERVFELDNSSSTDSERKAAYEAAGRLVLRQSDILIAVWDGEPAKGTGGTGQIVQEALDAKIPVLRIDSNAPHEITLLKPGRAAASQGTDGDVSELLRERLFQTLLPHSGDSKGLAGAAQAAHRFFSEKRLLRWRKAPELPLGLRHEGDDLLRTAFEWADNHANRLAFLYRGSYRMLYILGALAVLLAYLGSTAEDLPPGFPHEHLVFLALELAAILIIVALAFLGRKFQWHERWLDYRHLAESLRMTRLLVLVGRITSYFQVPAHFGKGDSGNTWSHFYLHALVRQAGLTGAQMDGSYREAFRALLYESVVGQEKYHRRKVLRCHLTQYWHRLAQALFILAAFACGFHFGIHGTNRDLGVLTLNLMVIVLPAFGGAIGAILHHGESERILRRSKALAERLRELRIEVLARRGHSPTARELGGLAEELSRICLAELMDWRFLFLDRPLVLPA